MRQIKRNTIWMLGIATLLAMTLGGCGDSSSSDSCGAHTGTNLAFVITTDYTTGNFSTIDLESQAAASDLATEEGTVESDNAGAYYNGRIYIINRGAPSNITVLDKDAPCQALSQFSVGTGTNPYAMAFNSDTEAYVLLYGSNDLLVVDPTAATDQIQSTIDLSGFNTAGDSDGFVQAGAIIKVNDYLFVALQRLNGWAVENDALLVVVDTTTNEIVDVDDSTTEVDAITLTGRNPQFMFYDETSGKILVSETGDYSATDGGIETVDPTTFEAEGFLIDESELGGDVGDIVVANGTGYVVVNTGTWEVTENTVAAFTVADGNRGADLLVNPAYIPSLTVDDQGRLFVPDRTTTAPGVLIYDTTDNTEITTGAIDVGLPPNVILVY